MRTSHCKRGRSHAGQSESHRLFRKPRRSVDRQSSFALDPFKRTRTLMASPRQSSATDLSFPEVLAGLSPHEPFLDSQYGVFSARVEPLSVPWT